MSKRLLVLAVLTAVAAVTVAQEPAADPAQSQTVARTTGIVDRPQQPIYSDLYCAGFITPEAISNNVFVAGGRATPLLVRFVEREYVYLSGSGFEVGSRYTILRRLRDPNKHESFPGQRKLLRKAGQPYAELGRVRVIGTKGNIAITEVEFSCSDIVGGDLAVPFAEKPQVAFRGTTTFDRFAAPNGKLTGRIVMAKEFDTMVGAERTVYLNVGANQGVKAGDYFRAYRTYDLVRKHEADSLSFHASTTEDTQKDAPSFPRSRLGDFPRITLGEMLVMQVTPTSSTALVTLSIEDIQVGDGVELE